MSILQTKLNALKETETTIELLRRQIKNTSEMLQNAGQVRHSHQRQVLWATLRLLFAKLKMEMKDKQVIISNICGQKGRN